MSGCSGCGTKISTFRTVAEGLKAAPRIARQVVFQKYVSPQVKDQRMAICEKCENFQPHNKRCIQCTCFLDKKTIFSEEECPIKKW